MKKTKKNSVLKVVETTEEQKDAYERDRALQEAEFKSELKQLNKVWSELLFENVSRETLLELRKDISSPPFDYEDIILSKYFGKTLFDIIGEYQLDLSDLAKLKRNLFYFGCSQISLRPNELPHIYIYIIGEIYRSLGFSNTIPSSREEAKKNHASNLLAEDRFKELILEDIRINDGNDLLKRLKLCGFPALSLAGKSESCVADCFLTMRFLYRNDFDNRVRIFLSHHEFLNLSERHFPNPNSLSKEYIDLANSLSNLDEKERSIVGRTSFLFEKKSKCDNLIEFCISKLELPEVRFNHLNVLSWEGLNALKLIKVFLLDLDRTARKKFISELLERSLQPAFAETKLSLSEQTKLIDQLTNKFLSFENKKSLPKKSNWQDRVSQPKKIRLSKAESDAIDAPFRKLDISQLNPPKWSNRENRLEKDSPVAFYLRHYDQYLDHADFAKCKLDSADVKNHDPMLYNALKGVERANEGQLPYKNDDGNTEYAAFPSKGERVLALVMKVQQGELEMPSDRLLRQSIHASARRHNVDLPTNEVSRG